MRTFSPEQYEALAAWSSIPDFKEIPPLDWASGVAVVSALASRILPKHTINGMTNMSGVAAEFSEIIGCGDRLGWHDLSPLIRYAVEKRRLFHFVYGYDENEA